MNKGFTLIELLVVISIIGVILTIGLASLASTIRSSTKATITNKVKQSGDLAVETITRTLRSAVDACSPDGNNFIIYASTVNCASPPAEFVVRFDCVEGDPDEDTPEEQNGEILRIDPPVAAPVQTPITSQVRVDSCAFAISNTTPKRALVQFTLSQRADFTTSESQVTIPFRSEVTLRNF